MIKSFFMENSLWTWWIVGFVLISIEIIAPGTFFLWFAFAAFAVGALTLIFGAESAFWGWQAQLIAFGVFAIASAYIGRRVMKNKKWNESDKPNLNDRGAQLVGTVAILTEEISEGTGRAKIGDSTWRVNGPDLAKGARVKIVSQDSGVLVVEPA